MGDATTILAGGWLARAFNGDLTAVVLVGVALLVLVAALFAMLLLSRKRFHADLREIVRALEEMRAGEIPDRAPVDASSPLALVSDSLNRLGQDVAARLRLARDERERARTMLDAVKDSVVITTDTDGDVNSVSAGAEEMFGWEERELLSQSAALLFDEASYKEFLPKLARRSLREQGIDVRVALQRRDGGRFPAELSVRMIADTKGKASGFVLRVKDTTEQVRLEKELREAEQRYRSLVEGLAEGVLIVHDGRVLYANPAFAELVGQVPRQLAGSALRDRIATRDVLMVEERLAVIQAGEDDGEGEWSFGLVDVSGQPPIEARAKASAVAYEGHASVLLLVRDETLERRVETELRRNEARLDGVLEAASDGILLLVDGADGASVQLVNRAFLSLFGMGEKETLGASERQLLERMRKRGGYASRVADFIGEAGFSARRELLAVDAAERGDLQVTLAPLSGKRGAVLGRVVACRDLKDQRASERKLQNHAEQLQLSKVMLEQAYHRLESLHGDLQRRTDELKRLNGELRKLDEMKSNLLGNVSHELQTPLVSIRGYTEMMLKERLGGITEEQRKGLSLCLKNIDRLISMIDNLLVFARSEDGEGLTLERFELGPLVQESAELLSDKMVERELSLSVDVAAEGLSIHADRDKIQQVFINLLSNAIKFNHPQGRIEISARDAGGGYAQVTMEDSGVGIPADALGRVFDRHYQVRRDADDSPQGSGIGLAIVREILLSHGCRIDVENRRQGGARFRFTLPLAGQAGAEKRPVEPSPESAPPADDPPAQPPAQEPPPEPARSAERTNDVPDRPRRRFRIIRRAE